MSEAAVAAGTDPADRQSAAVAARRADGGRGAARYRPGRLPDRRGRCRAGHRRAASAAASGWFYVGGGIALFVWAPSLAWQGSHGWPELT